MRTVFVFKTSICKKKDIKTVQPFLNSLIANNGYWNFDLEDCDNILRVETQNLIPDSICKTLHKQGFYCEELY
tara:strand:+ start:2919 stop:3137 length:219 start_codon:yes stop_codon:yes gene_type:complete